MSVYVMRSNMMTVGARVGVEVHEDGTASLGVGGGYTVCADCAARHDNPSGGWTAPYVMPCGHVLATLVTP